MKKRYVLFGIFLSLFFLGKVNANTIKDINMDIYIDGNGNAHVKEIWNYKSSKNTEIYHQYKNIGESTISDFKVSDSTGTTYELDNSWNINGSFDDKKFKYGYHYISNGVELCLGISHYGTYDYYLEYTINGFVSNLNDSQMAYWTLIQPTSEDLQAYYIKIYADEKFSDSLDIWGFGNYGGTAYVYDGYIEMQDDGPLNSNEYVTALIKFPSNTFLVSNKYDLKKDFSYYLDMAQEGSTAYVKSKPNFFSVLFGILCFIFPYILFFIIFFAIKSSSSNKKHLHVKKTPSGDIPYFRDLPCKKNILRAYFVANEYGLNKKQTDLLGAILLKWIKEGKIELKETEKNKLFGPKKEVDIELLATAIDDELENALYQMMVSASRDHILESKEFENYCEDHYETVLGWFDRVLDKQEQDLITEKLINVEESKTMKIFTSKKKIAAPKLDEMAMQMAGLKKYYKEFTEMNKKMPIEVKLWQEHLMYAQIFGVADKVAKDFKKLYPDVISDTSLNTVVFVHDYSYRAISRATTARSVAQARASSYSGGGGGFSSGGGGGGSFGGGGSMGSR